MLFENEKKTANGQQEGRCANAREGGRSIACCWFCIFKQDQPSQFKQTRAPISIKTKFQVVKVSPQTLCASKTALSPFLELEMVPSGFSPPELLRFLPQFFHHRCCAAARWWGRVLVGVTSSGATHALAKGGSDLWCNCYTPATRRYMSQLLLLGKFEYGGGPIFKVVLEC